MYIYKTTNLLNGKIYVGLSKYNPQDNPRYLGSGYILQKALKCYGKENFRKEILEICHSKAHCCERERYWIATLKSNNRDIGYNICEGGQWGDNFSNHPDKELWRQKLRESQVGKNNGNYGRRWSDEQKKAASERAKKNHHLIDMATGLNVAQLPEVRKKISNSKMGLKNPQSNLWELVSPVGEKFFIEGGIKREIRRYGVDYQQFRFVLKVSKNTRMNKKGWTLIKLQKDTMVMGGG